nr:uncharacterized protein LOC127340486 [Lolium perenne]
MVGIAEELPRQFAPAVGKLLVQGTSSAIPIVLATPSPASPLSSAPSSSNLGNSIRFASFEFTPHTDASRSTFSGLCDGMNMTFGSVHFRINSGGVLRLPDPIISSTAATSSTATSIASSPTTADLSAAPSSTPTTSSSSSSRRTMSTMSVGSDDSDSSDLTSYYCLDCDTRHELGSEASPFVCGIKYSSDEESTDEYNDPTPMTTMQAAHHQIRVIINAQTGAKISSGERTPRGNGERRLDGEASSSNANTTFSVSREEWEAARNAVVTNTSLPVGVSLTAEHWKVSESSVTSSYRGRKNLRVTAAVLGIALPQRTLATISRKVKSTKLVADALHGPAMIAAILKKPKNTTVNSAVTIA